MKKTIFDVEDISSMRLKLDKEYASMTKEEASKLRSKRAETEWNEIKKMRKIINDWYKCPNILSPQPDKLPMLKYNKNNKEEIFP